MDFTACHKFSQNLFKAIGAENLVMDTGVSYSGTFLVIA
jgi:hypothetical protein